MYDKLDYKSQKTFAATGNKNGPASDFVFPSEGAGDEVLLLHRIVNCWGNALYPLPTMVEWLTDYAANSQTDVENFTISIMRKRLKELNEANRHLRQQKEVLIQEKNHCEKMHKLALDKIEEITEERDAARADVKAWEDNWNRDNGAPDNTRAVIKNLRNSINEIKDRLALLEKKPVAIVQMEKIRDIQQESFLGAAQRHQAEEEKREGPNLDYRSLYHQGVQDLYISKSLLTQLTESNAAVRKGLAEEKLINSRYNARISKLEAIISELGYAAGLPSPAAQIMTSDSIVEFLLQTLNKLAHDAGKTSNTGTADGTRSVDPGKA